MERASVIHVVRPGIKEQTLIAARVAYSDYPEPGSIEIPYWTINGDPTMFKRWRLGQTRADGQKYYQQAGSPVYVYYPPDFFRQPGDLPQFGLSLGSLVLVEGEFKALCLLEQGIWTIGLPSFTVYGHDEEGNRRLIRDLQVTLSKECPLRIYYLGDSDTCTNFEFARNAEFLASAANPCQIFLPRIPIVQPKGIDDCKEKLGTGFTEFFRGLIETALPLPRKISAPAIALLLLEREQEALDALTGVERAAQFARLPKLCALACACEKNEATARLMHFCCKLLDITMTELKTAMKHSWDSSGITSVSQPEIRTAENATENLAEEIGAYYCDEKYYVPNKDGTYEKRNLTQFRSDLRSLGIKELMPSLLQVIDHQRRVDWAGPLAGHKAGLHHYHNRPFLVTEGPVILSAAAGGCPKIQTILAGLFGATTLPYVLGWLKIARICLLTGTLSPGQALIMVGPKNCGKSFTQEHILTPLLGGRSADPFEFMTGNTNFNADLFRAEHLMVNDQIPQHDEKARRQLGAYIKQYASNEAMRCHGKGQTALKLPVFARLSISCNDDDHSLLVLPPPSEDLNGKIILCAVQSFPFDWPQTAEQKLAFLEIINAEHQAAAHYVDAYPIPAEIQDQRYGVAGYQDPAIAKKLTCIGNEYKILHIARLAVEESMLLRFPHQTTSHEWFKLIWKIDHLREALRRITDSPDGVGRLFTCLVNLNVPGIYKNKIGGRSFYTIDRHNDEDDEE